MILQNKYLCFIIILQFQCISGRSNDDVVNDFEPVFKDLHEKYSKLEDLAHENIEPVLRDMKQTIFNETVNIKTELYETQLKINKAVVAIIEEEGLTENLDPIKHCIDDANKSKVILDANTIGGLKLCDYFVQDSISISENFSSVLYDQLHNEHYILDVTKEECVKLPNSFDVQECLIKDLYFVFQPYVEDITKEVNKRIEIIRKNFGDLQNHVAKCDKFLKNDILHSMIILLKEFQNCVIAAKP